MAIVRRRQNPPAYRSYKSFKKHLRIDFRYKCAYCRMHEYMLAGWSNFGVDHFEPKSMAPLLKCNYKNLYYCCNQCNREKRDTWPTDADRAKGCRFVDACSEVIYGKHLKCNPDGTLRWLTNAGEFTYDRIRLWRDDLVNWRRDRIEGLRIIRESRNSLRGIPRGIPSAVIKLFQRSIDAQQTTIEHLIRLYLNPPTSHKEIRRKRRTKVP